MEGLFKEAGYEILPHEAKADIYVINTCSVTSLGDKKSRQLIRRVQRQNPEAIIAVTGCYAQIAPEQIKAIEGVRVVLGTANRSRIVEYVEQAIAGNGRIIDGVTDIMKVREFEDIPILDMPTRTRAFLKIQEGCTNFCSYCIVPYVRGRERSRNPKDIIREIEKLVADGVVEVMLLGQNVNSYGKNLDEPMTFAQLLQEIEKIEGLERIRFMTSHPKDLSDELIEVMAHSKKICKHLHLPVQSGSTDVLKKMNRRYTKEQYLLLVEKIKKAIPDISLTTDIIVGFPGETEEDFQETLDVVRKVRYDSAFTFQYSKRTGTPAAVLEDQISPEVMKDRFDRLLKEVQTISAEVCSVHKGTVQRVLVETQNDHDEHLVTGRMSNNLLVHFPGDASLIGKLIDVELKECHGFYYMGEIVS